MACGGGGTSTSTSINSSIEPETTSSEESSYESSSSEESSYEPSSSEEIVPAHYEMQIRRIDWAENTYESPMTLKEALEQWNMQIIEASYYSGSFTKLLPEPNEIVDNFDELVYAIDYSAYYRLPSLAIKFSSLYQYEDLTKEFNKAFWSSALVPHAAGFTFEINNETVTVNFEYNEYANSVYSTNTLKCATNPYQITKEKGNYITEVPYEASKGELDVHNSDQLLFALRNGYQPVMEEGSPAKIIYDKAVSILKEIITDNMNDLQKIYAIDSYLTTHASYDGDGDDLAGATYDGDLEYPGKVASFFTSFYIEGPLLYHQGVCAGFAKAESLLMTLLGIDHLRVNGANSVLEDETYCKDTVKGYWYHGYNYYIASNGSYYICDPTYSFGGWTKKWNNEYYLCRIRRAAVAINRELWGSVYVGMNDMVSLYNPELIGVIDLDYSEYIYIDNNQNITFSSISELEQIVSSAKEQAASYKLEKGINSPTFFQAVIYCTSQDDNIYQLATDRLERCVRNGEVLDVFAYHNPRYNEIYGYHLYFAL